MHEGFIYFDIISLAVIIAHLLSIEKKGGQMGGMGGLPVKKKKF